MWLFMLGQYMDKCAHCFVLTVPWWDSCSCERTCPLSLSGINSLYPKTIKSSSKERWLCMCQNCLHGSGSWLQWAGNPCRMKLRNCWYSRSFSVCFWMSCSRRHLVVPPCRVLISVSVIYEWPLVSISASVSAFSESNSGLRESASEASFFLPFIHSAVKMYAISLVLNLCKHGFSISSRW